MTIVIAVLLFLIWVVLMCIYGALVKGLERAGLRGPIGDPPPARTITHTSVFIPPAPGGAAE